MLDGLHLFLGSSMIQMKIREKINRQMITDIAMFLLLAMAIVILVIIL